MAKLQGYLMRYKESPAAAVEHVSDLFRTDTSALGDSRFDAAKDELPVADSSEKTKFRSVRRNKRILSVSDIDRMVFNPQPGWDEGIKSI